MSTRGEIEARLEILERGFEGLLIMRENMEKILEENQRERVEVCQQLAELTALMQRNLHTNQEEPHGDGDQSDSNSASVLQIHNQLCEERWRKLEIQVLEGTDAYGWLNKVDGYFESIWMTEGEKLQAVMVAMEGKALAWYQWWEFSTQNPSWEEFRTTVLKRFQPSMTRSPFELLLSHKQTGTVEEYRKQFDLYARPLKCTEPSYLKGIFLNGLNDVIRAELKLHPVERLTDLMYYAQRVDEKNNLLSKGSNGASSGGKSRFRSYNSTKTVTWEPTNKSQSQVVYSAGSTMGDTGANSSFKGRGFKRLTDAELQEKRPML